MRWEHIEDHREQAIIDKHFSLIGNHKIESLVFVLIHGSNNYNPA